MRDRVRDRSRERSRDRSKPVKRDRAGSVAVASLPSNSKKMTEGERETSAQGLKSWWKSFSGNRTPSPPPPPGAGTGGMRVVGTSTATTSAVPVVFRAPLARVLTYASMQISTSRLDGSLYVWG
jgi:hypothetical protein